MNCTLCNNPKILDKCSCNWKYDRINNCNMDDYKFLNCLIDQFLPIGKETHVLTSNLLNNMLKDTPFLLGTCVLFNEYVLLYIQRRLYYRTKDSWNKWRIRNKLT